MRPSFQEKQQSCFSKFSIIIYVHIQVKKPSSNHINYNVSKGGIQITSLWRSHLNSSGIRQTTTLICNRFGRHRQMLLCSDKGVSLDLKDLFCLLIYRNVILNIWPNASDYQLSSDWHSDYFNSYKENKLNWKVMCCLPLKDLMGSHNDVTKSVSFLFDIG